MEAIKLVFEIGHVMALCGILYCLFLTIYFLIKGTFDPKKHQEMFFIGVTCSFRGIFIMIVALMCGLWKVLK